MGEQFLIDTNIIIYFLDDQIPDNQLTKILTIFEQSFNISTITYIEVLGWQLLISDKRKETESFLSNANIIFVDNLIQDKTVDIKTVKKIKTPDAIIGATAIVHNLTLVTRNESDFNHLSELKIYNPFA